MLLGGNAYLTLDNTDEPYLGGIRFTAMPPMKRFRYCIFPHLSYLTVHGNYSFVFVQLI